MKHLLRLISLMLLIGLSVPSISLATYDGQGVGEKDSPTFVTTDLTGVTDGNIPYMQAAGAGFGDSPLSTDGTDVTNSGDMTIQGGDLAVGVSATEPGDIVLHDAGTIILHDDGNNTNVAIGPVADGTNTLGVTGALDVSGSVAAGTMTVGSGSIVDSSGAISFGDENLTTTGTSTAGATTSNGVLTVKPDSTNEVLQVNDGTVDFTDGNAGTTGTMTVDASGNLSHAKKITAVGLDAGDSDIDNVGDVAVDSISSDAGTSINVALGSDAGDDFTVDTNKLVVEGDTGNVGIGTATPEEKFSIESGSALINVYDGTGGNGIFFRKTFTPHGTNAANKYNVAITTEDLDSDGSDDALVISGADGVGLNNTDTSAATPALLVKGGNVGIGDTSPDAKLDVETGDVYLGNGSVKLETSGKGIDYSATSDATGMTSELLADYEEGLHVATITCSTSGGFNFTSDTLAYTKIGRQVTVHGRIRVSSDSSCSGELHISLPFTAADLAEDGGDAYGVAQIQDGGTELAGDLFCIVNEGTAYAKILLRATVDNAVTVIDNTDVDGVWTLHFSVTYTAA